MSINFVDIIECMSEETRKNFLLVDVLTKL